jgi:NADH:ubiquinone oxidoreductase subunit 6 (subunit J)
MEAKKPISHFVAATVIAAVLIIYTLVLQFTGLWTNSALAWISYIFIVGGLILFINMYGNAMDNQVTFGNLFSYGFKTTALLALIMIAFTVILFSIFPNIREKMVEIARQRMEERNTPDDQIEKGIEMWQKMFWVFTIGGIILVYAIVGAIGSLIGAAVTKKKPVNPLDQMSV